MSKDYYKVLGVDKKASEADIKKAYRKLAHEHHPDKTNGNADKFKEINEAYQVLGNKEKRSQYDQFGSTFQQAGGGASAGGFNWGGFQQQGFNGNADFGDLGDIFGDFFGFGRAGRGRSNRGSDIEVELEIDFNESYFGGDKNISLYKNSVCSKCNGNGAEPGSKIEQCSTCKGSGKIRRVQNTMLGAMQVESACPSCDGRGQKATDPCRSCGGSGIEKKKEEFTISIPAGIGNGQSIKFSGRGEAMAHGGQSGDLYISFRVRPDRRFVRKGDDILVETDVSYATLSAGGEVKVPTVDGSVRLKIPAGTQSGKVFILRSKGFNRIHGRGRGDELVTVNVIVPTKLTKRQKELIEELERELGGKKKAWF